MIIEEGKIEICSRILQQEYNRIKENIRILQQDLEDELLYTMPQYYEKVTKEFVGDIRIQEKKLELIEELAKDNKCELKKL